MAIRKKLPKRIQPSITTQLILIIVLLIVPLNALVIQSTQKAKQVIIEQTAFAAQNVAQLYIQDLDNRMSSADTYLFSTADSDPDFLVLREQALDSNFERAWYFYFQKMNNQTNYYNDADAYFVYSAKADRVQVAARLGYTDYRYDLQKYLSSFAHLNLSPRWHIIDINGIPWLLRITKVSDFYYGALINIRDIETMILSNINYDTTTIAITETAQPIELPDTLQVSSSSKKAAIYAHISIDDSEITKSLPFFQRISVAAAIGYLLLIPILILILSILLLRPLHKVDHAMTQLKTGNPDFRMKGRTHSSEFANLFSSFNDMADNIKNLRVENYEKELAKQKMELRNLQLQIRPHFLLNTFNLIFTMTQNGDYAGIEKLVLYLSDYFRYIFRSGKELEIFEQELALIKGYLEVASIRYPDSLAVDYQISDEALGVEVPPLLIHNFVENIINHTMQFGKVIHIRLEAACHDGFAQFVIADDGPGFPLETVQQINAGKFQGNENKEHIGIRNSYQRIKYFYGNEAELKLESSPGQGARFLIRFPWRSQDINVLGE